MSINFSEVFVILLVALLVIKPEKLPETALMLGKWLRKLRQATAKIKRGIEEPLEKLTQEKPMAGLDSITHADKSSGE